jgi:hypothetical protein
MKLTTIRKLIAKCNLTILAAGVCICICIVACLWLINVGPSVTTTGTAAGAEEPSFIVGTAVERDYSPEEEHESNGPEGSAGVPMQRLSRVELGLAMAILLCSWRWCASKAPVRHG